MGLWRIVVTAAVLHAACPRLAGAVQASRYSREAQEPELADDDYYSDMFDPANVLLPPRFRLSVGTAKLHEDDRTVCPRGRAPDCVLGRSFRSRAVIE